MTVRPEASGRAIADVGPATWFACAGCGARPAEGTPVPLICPNAVTGDGIDHVLVRHVDPAGAPMPAADDPNPFIAYRTLFHAWHAARALGWTDDAYIALVSSGAFSDLRIVN